MKKRIFFILIIKLIFTNNIYSAFKDGNTISARVSGLGGAFTAIADDTASQMYNTAGLSSILNKSVLITYSKMFLGLDQVDISYLYFAASMPIVNIGTIGVGFNNFSTSDLYNENTFIVSYAVNINKFIKISGPEIYTGINFKYFYNSFTMDERSLIDPVFSTQTSSGNMGIDSGILIKKFINFLPELNAGIFIKNLNYPDIGIYSRDLIPAEYRFGLAYLFPYLTKTGDSLKTDIDFIYRNNIFNFAFGLEFSFLKDMLLLRTGINSDEFDFGAGTSYKINSTMKINFNYTFTYTFNISGDLGSHKISIYFYF